jgi:hypothetical protein
MDEGQKYDKKSLLTYNFTWNDGIWEWWNGGMMECWGISPLEGHASSWPDATKRVPPDLTIFQYSNLPVFLYAPCATRSANCVKTQSSDTTVSVASARVISLDTRMANNDLFIRQNAKSEGIFS